MNRNILQASLLTIALAISMAAQTAAAARQSAPVGQNTERGSKHEGIKVHGHWTIEIRNPDGALVSKREFENSIQQGASALTGILGRQSSPGFWNINLYASPDCGSDPGQSGPPSPVCAILEPISNLTASVTRSNNLAVAVTNSGASLTLTGSITAPVTLQITAVQTGLQLCNASTPSTTCATAVGISGNAFTSTNLATPVAASAGQTIAVTVVISFS